MPDQIGTIKTLMDMVNEQSPSDKVATNGEAIKAMGAMNTYGTLSKWLKDIKKLKDQGVNTGPLIGGWDPIGDRQNGPGPISKVLGAIAPGSANKRAPLYSAIKNATSFAFGEGGHNLSQNEAELAAAMIPTGYYDDQPFQDRIQKSLNEDIPLKLQEKAKLLLDMGMDEENVKKIMQRAME